MAYIQPDTTVQFLNVPFDPDYENTMYWDTLSAQNGWMETRVILTIGNNSYQRKSRGVIRVGLSPIVEGASIRNLYNANYLRFKNSNYENKWFYAFVDQVEYVNNNTVDVHYTIDVLQTWAMDYSLLECFIERQHTITDEVGEHTVPEGLETGEYFDERLLVSSGDQIASNQFEYTPAVVLITTFDNQGNYCDGNLLQGRVPRGNMFSGLNYTVYTLDDIDDLNDTLEAIGGNTGTSVTVISKSGIKIPRFLADGVIALFMCPLDFAVAMTTGGFAPPKTMGFDVRKNGSYLVGNYRVRNKKLMCYPYNLIYMTNNSGISGEFRWEDFASPLNAQFQVWGNASPNCGMYLAPLNYKSYTNENPEEMIQVNGFPMCAWTYDSYKAWFAQNAGTIGASTIGLAASWATALANPVEGVLSGAMDLSGYVGQHTGDNFTSTGISAGKGLIASTLGAVGQIYDHKRRAPQSSGNGNVGLNYQAGFLTFSYHRKHIKEEYAKIIDAYFDMYGYKVNMVGVPNRNARPCYTYIKTIGCAVDGLFPADDAKAIQSIFDKGIRFWKTTATFGVYDPLVNPNEVTIVG